MSASQSMTLPPKQNALPDTWIERLFQKMEDRYGALWVDRYGQFPRERVKTSWAEDLAGLSGEELKRGLDACKQNKFPPTLPEFLSLCRPPVDYEAAYHHAITQMHNRRTGEAERWNSRAIYWAAASLGMDLQQPYATIKGRWKQTLDEFVADEPLPEIPVAAPALPAPGQQTAAPEVVKAATATIKAMASKPRDCMQHWRNIRDKSHAGEKFPHIAIQYCKEALTNTREPFEMEPAP